MGEKHTMPRWSRCWAHPEFYSLGTKASAASNQNHFLSRRWRHPQGQRRCSRLPRAGLTPEPTTRRLSEGTPGPCEGC